MRMFQLHLQEEEQLLSVRPASLFNYFVNVGDGLLRDVGILRESACYEVACAKMSSCSNTEVAG